MLTTYFPKAKRSQRPNFPACLPSTWDAFLQGAGDHDLTHLKRSNIKDAAKRIGRANPSKFEPSPRWPKRGQCASNGWRPSPWDAAQISRDTALFPNRGLNILPANIYTSFLTRNQGQFCHSFCTYCFRWAQFTSVGSDQQFQSQDAEQLLRYLIKHPHITDVLFTGGDPMVMSAEVLRRYIVPILQSSELPHLDTIRIGTKSLAYWPYRYLTDPDAKALLELFAEIVASGRHLAFQAHFSNPRELETPIVQEAMRMIRMTGAQIRTQSPLIRNVNDNAETWANMWRLQTRLGAVPYYMSV
jgi:4Fe-4S single cluster domain